MHVFPHSHTDLGWQAPIDDYFEGKNLDSLYLGSIHHMFDSVLKCLLQNHKRTFNYAEMKFFKMWWDQLGEQNKTDVRTVIKRGQLQLVNGGFSAPDEATTNADDLIDNFMSGHRFLIEEVGIDEKDLPSVSWQLDSFGTSNGFGRLATDLGFDAMFFSREDIQQKKQTFDKKEKLQVWRADEANFGDSKDVLQSLITSEKGNYCFPSGFAVDLNYHEDIVFSPKAGNGYNADIKL